MLQGQDPDAGFQSFSKPKPKKEIDPKAMAKNISVEKFDDDFDLEITLKSF